MSVASTVVWSRLQGVRLQGVERWSRAEAPATLQSIQRRFDSRDRQLSFRYRIRVPASAAKIIERGEAIDDRARVQA